MRLVRIIDRYVGRQIIGTTLFAVAVLSLVLVLGNIFKELLEELVERPELDIAYVLRFIANVLPFSLIFTIPWGFLTAVLLIFGRLSADNELISLRMAGLSMPRICAPVLLFSIVLSALSFYLNVAVAPRAQSNVKTMAYQLALKDPLMLFTPGEVIDMFPGYLLYAEDKFFSEERNQRGLKNLQLVELNQESRPLRFTVADSAFLHNEVRDDGEIIMVMDLLGARIENKDSVDVRDYSKISAVSAESTTLVLSLNELQKKHSRVRPGTMTDGAIREMLGEEELDRKMRTNLRTELSKRYSFSLACITFGLIGVPLGVTAQRRETSIGFALSMIIASVYFLFIIVADSFRDDPGTYPHVLMWIPNAVFVGLGCLLFYRLSKR